MYENMCLALFANGSYAIMAKEEVRINEYMLTHLQEFFEDVEVYWWKAVREYHAAWHQLLEQGRAAWGDESKRAQLRLIMVWSKPSLSSRLPYPPSTSVTSTNLRPPTQTRAGRFGYVAVPSKPDDRACSGYNRSVCSMPHTSLICMYALIA